MQNKNWKKRIILTGLIGTMAIADLTGCQKPEIDAKKILNGIEKESSEKNYFVPDLALVEYKEDGIRKANIVELETFENEIRGSFITNPNRFLCIKAGENSQVDFLIESEDSIKIDCTDIRINTKIYSHVQQYCEMGEGIYISKDTILDIENGYGQPLEIHRKLIENTNHQWKEYEDIITVEFYPVDDEIFVSMMGLESDSKNKRVYKSFSNPNVTLVETVDADFNIINNEIVIVEQNKEIRQKVEVIKRGIPLSVHQWNYNEIQSYENYTQEQIIFVSEEERKR